jgi:hypothetical protein
MEEKEYIAVIKIGQIVKLRTDPENLDRICTGISVRKNSISYDLAFGDKSSWHYEFEIDFKYNKTTIGFR